MNDLAKARIRTELFGTETSRQIRQLMGHDLRACLDDSRSERVRVEDVDDHGVSALPAEPGRPLG